MGRSPAVKSETFVLEEFCGKTDVLDTLPTGSPEELQEPKPQEEAGWGLPSSPILPKVGPGLLPLVPLW